MSKERSRRLSDDMQDTHPSLSSSVKYRRTITNLEILDEPSKKRNEMLGFSNITRNRFLHHIRG